MAAPRRDDRRGCRKGARRLARDDQPLQGRQPDGRRGVRRAKEAVRVPVAAASGPSRLHHLDRRGHPQDRRREQGPVPQGPGAGQQELRRPLHRALQGRQCRGQAPRAGESPRERRRDRRPAAGQARPEPQPALRRREIADQPGLPLRPLPLSALAVLLPGRGRRGPRRRQPGPLPRPPEDDQAPDAVHPHHPQLQDDGSGRLHLRHDHGRAQHDPASRR